MNVVLDATAIIALLQDESTIDAHLASATRVLAPDLAVVEVLNVRWRLCRAKMRAPGLEAILAAFDRISLTQSRDLAVDADQISVELDHPVYDCLYVALAARENARLLTADRRLARKLSKSRIDVVTLES